MTRVTGLPSSEAGSGGATHPGPRDAPRRRASGASGRGARAASDAPSLAPSVVVRPATRYEDVAAIVGPRKPTSNVCFCLSYHLPAAEARELRGPARAMRMRELCGQDPAPGVVAYLGEEPVGWAAVHPRADTGFATNRRIPAVDDLPVWSLWCFRVRPGYRKQGITHALIDGAVAYARACGAPAIEGYPVDNGAERVDLTMAYVGTRALFERAGFHLASPTASVLDGFPRVLMRKDLRTEPRDDLRTERREDQRTQLGKEMAGDL